jgi:hypothetical protein
MTRHIKLNQPSLPVFGLLMFTLVLVFYFYFCSEQEKNVSEEVLNSISTGDLIAMVFWDKDNSESMWQEINDEKQKGLRDEVLINQE